MINDILAQIRAVSDNLKNAIIRPLEVDTEKRTVNITIVTDNAFTPQDKAEAEKILRGFVPQYFYPRVTISKLTPDCDMVKAKILAGIEKNFKAVYATVSPDDVTVNKTDDGFEYTIAVITAYANGKSICDEVTAFLKTCFCGNFSGVCVENNRPLEDFSLDDEQDEIEYELPVRTFPIRDFTPIESTEIPVAAIYISDINLAGNSVVICGEITDVRERKYTNKKGQEKEYLSFVISDGTGSTYVTYFLRLRTADKIKALRIGDSIVCSGKNEEYRGNLRFTATYIDYGKPPENFVPEKRQSKPVPKFYHFVKPQEFTDISQTDIFEKTIVPDCLKDNTFVVFDLETTGLNSSPVSGNMDRIIEIAAYKVVDGSIKECFSSFVNPGRRLSDEIIRLTGITEDMVAHAPTFEQVMPDFFKFCAGSILVGHNIAGFDFKFVDYYCARIGYILERKIIDTITLSQELLFLSNYKLNTVADHFGITFNHHRATDDALVTAKIFIELLKIKKSLPKLQ